MTTDRDPRSSWPQFVTPDPLDLRMQAAREALRLATTASRGNATGSPPADHPALRQATSQPAAGPPRPAEEWEWASGAPGAPPLWASDNRTMETDNRGADVPHPGEPTVGSRPRHRSEAVTERAEPAAEDGCPTNVTDGVSTRRDSRRGSARRTRRGGRDDGRKVTERRRTDPDTPPTGEADPQAVARNIALRQLTMAPRTRAQLHEKLTAKGCEPQVIDVVLDRLVDVGLIDDAAFAESFVRSRRLTKGSAKRSLAYDLRRKGVEDDIIDDALADIDAEDETDLARALVDKRLRSLHGLDQAVQIRRLAGMLARKGYGSQVSYRVIREALAAAQEHQRD